MTAYQFNEPPFDTAALQAALQDSAPTWVRESARSDHA